MISMYRDNDILTVKECMQYLKTGRNTILSLLGSGQLRGFKIAGRWKVKMEEIQDYLRYM